MMTLQFLLSIRSIKSQKKDDSLLNASPIATQSVKRKSSFKNQQFTYKQ